MSPRITSYNVCYTKLLRVFTLGFASLDYTDPKRNQTAYMLEGFDKDRNNFV